jgi:LacI family transcriptional regulator
VTRASQRATIEDVAKAAGVSVATVSQVLNGRRPVATSTKARVLQIIEELGYRPNAFGRGLRTSRSDMVGVVLPDLANPFYPALVRGLQNRLYASGYHTVICNTDGDPAHERELLADLIDRQVDGLVLVTFTLGPSDLAAIVPRSTPLIVIGTIEGFDHVHTNDLGAAYEMTTYLLEAGYESVGHLAGPKGVGPADLRLAGYEAAINDRGQGGVSTTVARGEFSLVGGAKALVNLVERGALPRSIFCANDLMALGAIEAAQSLGLDVPNDLAVAGFDDIEAASLLRPALTTVANPVAEVGTTAATVLLERMAGSVAPPVDIEISCQIRSRQTA